MIPYSISLINIMALALFAFGVYIFFNHVIRKRGKSEWTGSTITTLFLWGGLALATDFLLQMAITDRLTFHLITIPVSVVAWLIVRFYYRIKVF